MDVNGYMGVVEQNVDNAAALERVRAEALDDATLSDSDKRAISERVGTYLADQDRAQHGDSHDPDSAPDEEA